MMQLIHCGNEAMTGLRGDSFALDEDRANIHSLGFEIPSSVSSGTFYYGGTGSSEELRDEPLKIYIGEGGVLRFPQS
jgi:hypothetical protein